MSPRKAWTIVWLNIWVEDDIWMDASTHLSIASLVFTASVPFSAFNSIQLETHLPRSPVAGSQSTISALTRQHQCVCNSLRLNHNIPQNRLFLVWVQAIVHLSCSNRASTLLAEWWLRRIYISLFGRSQMQQSLHSSCQTSSVIMRDEVG